MSRSIQEYLRRLEKGLNPIINKAMHKDISKMLEEQGKKQVQETVYNVYTPIGSEKGGYDRTYQLRDKSWESTPLNQGLIFRNVRTDEETGKYIPRVIETGEGYDFTGKPVPFPYEAPRPFMSNLKRWLAETDQHTVIVKKAINKMGFKTRV